MRLRLVLVYAASVPLAWGAAELHLHRRERPHFDPGMPAAYQIQDDDVGDRPAADVSWREALWLGDEPIYDAVYTTDAHGRRTTPEPVGAKGSECVLFFGGSFTWGTGIADVDTLPWQTAVASDRRRPFHSFSFRGWGPHQMLAELESGEVERTVGCEPTHAIYVSVHDHVRRVAGRSPWDPHGPRFELRDDRLVRDGNFGDRPSWRRTWPARTGSELLRILAEHFVPGPRDFELFAAVVSASRDRLVARWPGIDFRALLWDKRWKQEPEYWESLLRRGIAVHFVSEILPDLREHALRYAVSPHDGHPNRTANERIAGWIATQILGEAGARATGDPEHASAPSRAGGP